MYKNKLDNVVEMNKFPERKELEKLKRGEIDLNMPIVSQKTQISWLKTFCKEESRPDGFAGKSYKCLKMNKHQFFISSQKSERKEWFLTHFLRPDDTRKIQIKKKKNTDLHLFWI